MTFFSVEFCLGFMLFFVLYHCIRHIKAQNFLLLAFNACLLYFISVYTIIIIVIFAFFVHYFALYVYARFSRYALVSSACFLVLNLAFFKYFPELKSDIDAVLFFFNMSESFDFMFPVGLSFYTFNAITYIHYVYKHKKVRTFLELLAYLSFFATFLSGPIFRANNFFAQYDTIKRFANEGKIITLILFAATKKILIANYLSILLDEYSQDFSSLSILGLLDIVWIYALMLYFDFSAYMNLVRALALMLGYELPRNFDMPYTARSIKEFWQKWHISLSSFFKDFVYIPLGGSRSGFWRTQLNVLIVFILSGIWHNNTANYALWGALHGLCLIAYNIKHAIIKTPLPPMIARFITFNVVSILWAFFYFESFDDILLYFDTFKASYDYTLKDLIICASVFVWFIVYQWCGGLFDVIVYVIDRMGFVFQSIIIIAVLSFVFLMMPDGIPSFIYSSF